ncbi:kinesin-like protein KIF20A isoform X3 [Syngnathus typhle]|uniref:kinesin-like protein KIF20A isoform X3 n=1 Tax=Syngnathus typhle TaxID=161592 RepID=UPI002A6AD918|nr:kinesin-like protein KIF20A isoform X3 [Syngnathus typhle]
MAGFLYSTCTSPFDDGEDMAVFESTAADYRGSGMPRLPELSLISPGPELAWKPAVMKQGSVDKGDTERVNVFLRIRPLTEVEREKSEDQECVEVQDEETLLLRAPSCSQNMKVAERGISPSMHKFTFTKICGPETTQQDFYECTMKEMVKSVLQGENRLLYTYGVTNSGKTYTIQGRGRDAGLLPRALVSLFQKLQGRLYGAMDLKPVLYQDVRHLEPSEVRVEEIRRNTLLKEVNTTAPVQEVQYMSLISCTYKIIHFCAIQDENPNSYRGGNTTTWDSGVGGLSSTSHIATQMEDCESVCLEPDGLSHSGGGDLEKGLQFSIWVSFYEIYNEFLYDLLDGSPSLQPRKRITLRLSDDQHGNPYVKGLTWVQVRSAEEAWKILRTGQRNQSFASTHLNQNSSRSHCIFSVRVLHIRPDAESGQNMHISELTVCDLAGSERCKEQRSGERMKEANNINTSLLTLGRCIAALRHNQTNKSRPPQVVPFRDSKLTRVLQGFFCGRGTSSMVVNINTCASIYDETLQALKFSAIASQLLHAPATKNRVAKILSLLREQANENDAEDECDGEDVDTTVFNALDTDAKRLEAEVREQVVNEMMEVINTMQADFSELLEAQKDRLEKRCEDKIQILQKYLKSFYRKELKERDEQIEELSAALDRKRTSEADPSSSPQTESERPRRSERVSSKQESSRLQEELQMCRALLHTKTEEVSRLKSQLETPGSAGTNAAARKLEEGQRNLRQLRSDLQKLGSDLQSGERACCRNTSGERLRQALAAADETLIKQL